MKEKMNIYSVPEGYFESLKPRLEAIAGQPDTVSQPQRMTLWTRVEPYVTLAACFVMAVMAGSLFIGRNAADPTNTTDIGLEDFVYADIIPMTNPYYIYEDYPVSVSYQENESSTEDVIQYLINTGANIDYIEYMLNQ